MLDLAPKLGLNDKIQIKFHIFPFSAKYDYLLGFESMKELNCKINCEKQELTLFDKILIKKGNIHNTTTANKNNKKNTTTRNKDKNDYKKNNNVKKEQSNFIEKHETQKIKTLLRHDHINKETKDKLIKLIGKYPTMIKEEEDPLKATNLIKHTIPLKTDKPIFSRNYRYPQQFKNDLDIEIQKLLKANIIRESNSPYNSPVWVVPKKLDASNKRKIRMVIDYRKLNQETVPDKFPLPNIEDLLNKLNGSKIFSTIDLTSGFHQIEMDPESIPKTAFSTDTGHYEFLRMPFGLCNAPPTFQRAMNMMLSNTPNTLVYMDDIIIFSSSIDEHLKHLETVFDKLCKHSLSIQLDKTEFLKEKLPFLGHIITADGIHTNPDKIKAIENFPLPTNPKEIKQFLGMTGYYRKFIHNYAHIAKPLTLQLRKDHDLNPIEYKESFELLKTHMVNAPILQFPDWNLPFILTTDASSVALGAVLSQISEGKDHPIAFASRTLSATEQRYATIEKELLAIVYACTHFKPYLYGKRFTIQTDHKPLQWLFSMKNANTRLMKWIFYLTEFEFDIKHIEGKTNYVADALSRVKINESNAIDLENEMEIDILESLEQNSQEPTTLLDEEEIERFNELQQDGTHTQEQPNDNARPTLNPKKSLPQQKDEDNDSLVTVHSQESSHQQIWVVSEDKPVNVEKNQLFIQRGGKKITFEKPFGKNKYTLETAYPWTNDLEEILTETFKPNTTYGIYCEPSIETIRDEFEGIFRKISQLTEEKFPTVKLKRYNKHCLDITHNDQQTELIENYHVGKTCHRGILETYNRLKRLYYFPRMKDIITNYINSCPTCRKTKYDRKPIKTKYCITNTPDAPFEELMMDTLHYEQKLIVTIIDTFSKRLYAQTIRACNAVQVSQVVIKYLETFPAPNVITMDNGPEYKNTLLQNLLETQGIEAHYTAPNHPNSLGLMNRAHSTLIEILRNLKESKPKDELPIRLSNAVIAFNNTINQTLKLTPNEITFGVKPRHEATQTIKEKLVEKYHDRLKLIHEQIKINIHKEKEERTKRLNETREEPIIEKEPYVKRQTRNKHENPYKRVCKFKDKNKTILVHTDNIQRPRKHYNTPSFIVTDKNDSDSSSNIAMDTT